MTLLLGALAGNLPDIRTEAHEITKRQVQEWFGFMDRTLDVHRAKFLFREPTPKETPRAQGGFKVGDKVLQSDALHYRRSRF